MKYEFQFAPSGERGFAALAKSVQKRILNKLNFFEKSEDPFQYAKKLEGYEKAYRLRIGDYRVIFTPRADSTFVILLILRVGHRREIYDQ